jgi:hypothetical protein
MAHATRNPLATILATAGILAFSVAHAFSWMPFEFPDGNQGYTLEFTMAGETTTMDIDIVERNGSYEVTTTTKSTGKARYKEEISDILLGGGGGFGMMGFGALAMFGPAFMFMPMLMNDQDVRVRSEPIVVLGLGSIYMEREETIAGKRCVVIRMQLANTETIELAVAENVPVPCYSKYGTGGESMEVRLVSVR